MLHRLELLSLLSDKVLQLEWLLSGSPPGGTPGSSSAPLSWFTPPTVYTRGNTPNYITETAHTTDLG